MLEPLYAARAKENQRIRKGDQPGATIQKSGKLKSVKTDKQLAAKAGVSHDTIHKVKAIKAKAAPEIIERISQGEATVAGQRQFSRC